jgi:hypothetical protein
LTEIKLCAATRSHTRAAVVVVVVLTVIFRL